ncbi:MULTISPECIES: MFS transporter [Rhodococcus]|uniref:MFS transporter n=1 Tax=Rhodococcus pseudokoreensis TaxID=2811421 RepID=A0A974WCS0_9NOCA|nr:MULTISPECIES: MFS transporter [Rhodococcus]MBV6761958.1 MFS transporter [Rhodococcus opacus]QSE94982.1 MFS transporter [Rhodococcus pseudokoreensis]
MASELSSSHASVTGVRVGELIDRQPVGRFHYLLLALAGAVMFLDGFDTQAISFAAPSIAHEWGLPVASLGPIFSAAIVGLMVGYLCLAPLAHRSGQRRAVVFCTAMFGILTLLCAFTESPLQLIALRFLTGAGLGAAIPSLVGLVSEFAPARRRSSFVMFIYCWYAFGFVAAGVVSGFVIPLWGWRAMFIVGGTVPLVLLMFLLRYFPESPRYLLLRGAGDRANATLRRLDPALPCNAIVLADASEDSRPAGTSKGKTSAVLDLVRGRWFLNTLLLWLAFGANLAAFYAIQSWLPTIVGSLGQSSRVVIACTVLTTVGGIAAAMFIGPAMDRISPFRTLGTVYLVGAGFVALLGWVLGGGSTVTLLVAAFLTGTCVTGGQMSVIALATVLYPTDMRSTGVGWALGIGRLGGIAAPLIVGAALSAGVAPREVFFAMAMILVVAGFCVLALERRVRAVPQP